MDTFEYMVKDIREATGQTATALGDWLNRRAFDGWRLIFINPIGTNPIGTRTRYIFERAVPNREQSENPMFRLMADMRDAEKLNAEPNATVST